ncbi:MAG: helix-turn-helix domain-containing protein [Phaeodactylibacter sp.]|nr:helix-turn-helix domain-containing protein [Phaeodactylibacter sp.]
MYYREYHPAPAISNWVSHHFVFTVPGDGEKREALHTIIPDGGASLVFHFNQPGRQAPWARFTCPRTENLETPIYPGSVYFGSRFYPGVSGALLGRDMRPLRNRILEAQDCLPGLDPKPLLVAAGNKPEFDEFHLLDEAVFSILPEGRAPDGLVMEAAAAIHDEKGKLKISGLVGRLPISERPLQKRFRRHTGLTMKELARICRLRAAVFDVILRGRHHTDAFLDAGFFDQAHYINEFLRVSGMLPSAFYRYIRQVDSSVLEG